MLRKIKSFNFILNSVGQADGILIPKLRKRSRCAKCNLNPLLILKPEIDLLSNFNDPVKKPKLFKVTLAVLTAIITLNIYFLTKRMYNSIIYSGIILEDLYLLFLLIVYPLISYFGVLNSKKYGWFIFSHFTLSNSIITFLSLISIFSNKDEINDNALLFIIVHFILNTFCIFNLFNRQFLNYFGLKRDQIFAVIVVTILFPVLNGVAFYLLSY